MGAFNALDETAMEYRKDYVSVSASGLRLSQYALGDNEPALSLACSILNDIYQAYSENRWFVQVKGGVIFIRELSFPSNWGMVRKLKDTDFSASNLKHDVMLSAGEWLEKANMARGSKNGGEDFGRVEGVLERWQPVPLVKPESVTDLDDLRTTIRPQALNG